MQTGSGIYSSNCIKEEVMEYMQMTIDQWLQMKQRLTEELLGIRQSYVRVGYFLRKIDECKGYLQDGYKSVAEFAKAEYGLEASTVSRFMQINREYSIDGYSEFILPEYMDFSRSQLEEMLKLPELDRQMIRPDTPRESIRELKRFNKEASAEPMDAEDEIRQLVEKFYRDNPDTVTELFTSGAYETGEVKKMIDIINPSGNRTYRTGMYFMMMYKDGIKIKKFGAVTAPEEVGWGEFFALTQGIFAEDAAGEDTYRNHFGDVSKKSESVKEPKEKPQPVTAKEIEKKPAPKKSASKLEKQPDESIEVVPGVKAEIEDIEKAQEAARLDMKKAEIEAVPTYTHEDDEPVENHVDNLPEEEIAPAQKPLKEPGTEPILEDEETDKIEQWKTTARSAAEDVCQAMENSEWSTAVTSARQLLHFLELVEHAEGGQE